MKSRITIEVNFDEGNLPVIQIINVHNSDDVRDKLISSFLQSLQHTSRWCKILYIGNASYDERERIDRWHIVPIKPAEINSEMELMKSVLNPQKPN